jgi:hypothetical protein
VQVHLRHAGAVGGSEQAARKLPLTND